MGTVKQSKKFKKNHLKDKIKRDRLRKKNARPEKSSSGPKGPAQPKNPFTIKEPEAKQIEDPEFEKYLSDSEASGDDNELVDQEEQEYLNGIEASSDEDDDAEMSEPEAEALTVKQVHDWEKQLSGSPAVARDIIKAFANEEQIADLKAVDALMNLALGPLPVALREMLALDKNQLAVQNKRFKSLDSALKAYAKSLGSLLKNGTNKRINKILGALQKCMPYFLHLKGLKDLVKSFCSVLVNPNIDDEPKLVTFSVIKEACTQYPNSLLDLFLKSGYEALLRLAKTTNVHTLESINLAKNLFGMLYTVDASKGYQMAFQQVRTLALNLKSALDKKKNPDMDVKVIYTWQYVQSLDYFSRVIALGAGELEAEKKEDMPADLTNSSSPLLQLIHPLVQITLRTLNLVPKPAYLPLRFYLVRSLVRLCRHTGVYIPLNSVLLEVLQSTAITRKALKSSLGQFDFEHNIHAPESYVGTQVYQNGLNEELVDLLAESLVLYSKNIAFPEIAGPMMVTIKRFAKKNTQNVRLNKQLQTFADRVDANSELVLRKRSNVDFGPRDKEQVAAFLKDLEWEKTPLGQFVVVRRKVRDERLKVLRQSKEVPEDEGSEEDGEAEGSESESGSEDEDEVMSE